MPGSFGGELSHVSVVWGYKVFQVFSYKGSCQEPESTYWSSQASTHPCPWPSSSTSAQPGAVRPFPRNAIEISHSFSDPVSSRSWMDPLDDPWPCSMPGCVGGCQWTLLGLAPLRRNGTVLGPAHFHSPNCAAASRFCGVFYQSAEV